MTDTETTDAWETGEDRIARQMEPFFDWRRRFLDAQAAYESVLDEGKHLGFITLEQDDVHLPFETNPLEDGYAVAVKFVPYSPMRRAAEEARLRALEAEKQRARLERELERIDEINRIWAAEPFKPEAAVSPYFPERGA